MVHLYSNWHSIPLSFSPSAAGDAVAVADDGTSLRKRLKATLDVRCAIVVPSSIEGMLGFPMLLGNKLQESLFASALLCKLLAFLKDEYRKQSL